MANFENAAPVSQSSAAYNGRIDFAPQAKPYTMFSENTDASCKFSNEATKHTLYKTALSDLFFSKRNIDGLQEAIRYQVYLKTNNRHVISRQSDTELHIIMRSTYLQYAKNIPFDLAGQAQVLNKIVIDYCVPIIVQEIKQYEYYKADISSLPVPMERSKNVSNAGTKVLFTKDL